MNKRVARGWLSPTGGKGANPRAASPAERYRVLLEVGRSLSATLSLDNLYRAIYRETARVMEARGFFISLYDEDQDLATVVFYADRGEEERTGITYRGSQSEVIRTGKPVLVRDRLENQSLLVIGGEDGHVTRSAISAPLRYKDRVIGALSAQSYGPDRYDQDDLELLQGIADIAAVATKNARYVAELERRRREAEKLEEIGRALAGALDFDEVVSRVIEAARELLDTEEATVWLLDEGRVRVVASDGPLALPVGRQVTVSGGIVRELVERRRSLLLEDVQGSALLPPSLKAVVRARSSLIVPLLSDDRVSGALSAGDSRHRAFTEEDAHLLRRLAGQASVALENARLHKSLQTLSMTDPLTGLPNRRHLEVHLERELAAARRGRSLSLVLFDLDNFKRYNDKLGHLAGDEVLKSVARIMAAESRAMNLVARYGGDEFVSVLSDTGREGAEQHAERVSRRILADPELSRHGISVSLGVATFEPATGSAEDLIRAADREMYRMKGKRGRSATPREEPKG